MEKEGDPGEAAVGHARQHQQHQPQVLTVAEALQRLPQLIPTVNIDHNNNQLSYSATYNHPQPVVPYINPYGLFSELLQGGHTIGHFLQVLEDNEILDPQWRAWMEYLEVVAQQVMRTDMFQFLMYRNLTTEYDDEMHTQLTTLLFDPIGRVYTIFPTSTHIFQV